MQAAVAKEGRAAAATTAPAAARKVLVVLMVVDGVRKKRGTRGGEAWRW